MAVVLGLSAVAPFPLNFGLSLYGGESMSSTKGGSNIETPPRKKLMAEQRNDSSVNDQLCFSPNLAINSYADYLGGRGAGCSSSVICTLAFSFPL